MKAAGIQANTHRRFRVSTTDSNHPHPIAENLVNRQFQPEQKNEIWTADITSVATDEGWLYLAAVEDSVNRQTVGWSVSDRIDSRLAVDALEMAIARQRPGTSLVTHSGRGVQYASEHYQRLLKAEGISSSMSRKGNCWDNAPMESFFATLKGLVHHERYHTRARSAPERVRVHRSVLQPHPPALGPRLPVTRPVR